VNATLAELGMDDADKRTDADTEHVQAAMTDDVDAYMRSPIDQWRG
jgi:hypothetical protein